MSKVILAFVFAGALITTIIVSRYLTLNPDVYFPDQRETYMDHTFGIISHVAGSMIAMALGPFQFLAGLRKKRPAVHQWMGRVYLVGVLIGGLAGFYMAFFAYGGFPSSLGFGMLSVIWLMCGAMALYQVRRRDFAAHREWMLRSYALTLAAFTLRIYLGIHGTLLGFELIDLPFTQMYIAVAWICWVPNMVAIECYIGASRKPAHAPIATSAA